MRIRDVAERGKTLHQLVEAAAGDAEGEAGIPCRCRTLGLLIVVGAADAAGLDPAVVAADQLGHACHRLIKGRRLDRDVGGIDDLFRILGRDIALFGPGPGCGCRCVRGWNRGKTVGLVRRHLGSRIAFKIVVGGISPVFTGSGIGLAAVVRRAAAAERQQHQYSHQERRNANRSFHLVPPLHI